MPTLVALRRQFPAAQIGWAIEEMSYSLLKGHPMVDRFYVYPRRAFKRGGGSLASGIRSMRAFRKELAAAKYEVAVDLQGLTKSGMVAWWSGAARRIGFKGDDSRELNLIFNNERVAPPADAFHVVEKNLALVKPLGVKIPDKPEWVMPSYDEETQALKPFLEQCGLLEKDGSARRYAIVNPGATWYTKRWPPECFGQVAKGLIEQHDLPVVVPWCGPDERHAAETIVGLAGARAFLAPETNLRALAALTARAVLFVGNDTGPLHLAVALGVQSVAIFGATDPLRNGPYGAAHRMQTGGVDCHPCWKTTCARQDRACLTWVKPEAVLASCAHSLTRGAKRRMRTDELRTIGGGSGVTGHE
ncbi:MAG: glycosyltransferase family 9 protein [Planctomycetota bacterium]|nr:glycosyltransferase family 9 protein [Planctomycetota bacterium]